MLPNFLEWWKEMGPDGFQEERIYLRTAIGVGQGGWANYDYVKMPEYRWGIFLANPRPATTIGFGDHMGEKLWDQVPGEHRKELRRLIVTQGDTEPASVEFRVFGRLSAWQNWIFQRPNATGERGALTLYGQPESPEFDPRRT